VTRYSAGMAPQTRGVVPTEFLAKIEEARELADKAELLVKQITVDALVQGASFPELSKATGISTSTLQRWVRELGATPAGRRANADWAAALEVWSARLERMRAQLDES